MTTQSTQSEIDKPHFILDGDRCPLLSTLTTFEVGGRPQYYAQVNTVEEALIVARWTYTSAIPLWILGGGSNVLCDDDELKGCVLQLALDHVEWEELVTERKVRVTLEAGVKWNTFVEDCVSRRLAGVECLIGIPGWVGAAPIQNIGAYGQSLSDVCESVYVYDVEQDDLRWWVADECDFAYRDSIFKRNLGRYLILGLRLILDLDGPPTLQYPQLIHRLNNDFSTNLQSPTLAEVSHLVKILRTEKSMIWQQSDPNHRSAGSFFMNPIISPLERDSLLAKCQDRGIESPPQWPTEEGLIKVPAAWLIEHSGYSKGFRYKNVGLSTKHCLALINCGEGRYQEVLELAAMIQQSVWQQFTINLKPEARILSSNLSKFPLGKQMTIALVTCSSLPDWEVDDHPLWTALEQKGINVQHPTWDNVDFDWASCDLVIPRTTWDYQERWDVFLDWLQYVDKVSTLLNPLSLMKWNIDKIYLKDLEISQPPIEWIEQETLTEDSLSAKIDQLIKLCKEKGWIRSFLKPSIAASAIGTLRFDLRDTDLKAKLTEHLREWLPKRTMILQPYVHGVETIGECSLIYFSGSFSHGVRKVPMNGDYRVQDDYGASDFPWQPPRSWLDACQTLIDRLPTVPLYARCDCLHGPGGEPWLIELELIEPSLFFRHDPQSAERFAKVIVEHCQSASKSN